MSKVLFVYALDGDVFSEVSNFAHKIFSPRTYSCNLCMITNGMMTAKRQWTDFVRGLGVETTFLHRDQFKKRYANETTTLPAAFMEEGGKLQLLISSEEINGCRDLDSLIAIVRQKVKTPAQAEQRP